MVVCSAGILPAGFRVREHAKRRRDAGPTQTAMGKAIKVGILAVQGDFEAHAATLARIGVDHVFVRTPRDLEGVDAVILPGGESTTQWKFVVEEGFDKSHVGPAVRGGAIV